MAEKPRVLIEVEDEELMEAINKVDEALSKRDELTDGTVDEEEQKIIQVMSEVEALTEDVVGLELQAEEASNIIDQMQEGGFDESRLKGINIAARQVIMKLPEIRTVYSLLGRIRMLLAISPEVAAVILAVQAISYLVTLYQRMEKERMEYEKMVRQQLELNKEQYERWKEEGGRMTDENYRGSLP